MKFIIGGNGENTMKIAVLCFFLIFIILRQLKHILWRFLMGIGALNTKISLVFKSVQYFSSYCHFKVFVFSSLALLQACSLFDIQHQILAKVLDRYEN